MLTTAQAAERLGRHPATIRRWIRTGRLCAYKVGRAYVIDEGDLELMLSHAAARGPNWVRLIREARDERNARLLEFLRAGQTQPTPQPGVCD